MKKRKSKMYYIKCTVWEYYAVEAESAEEAMKKAIEDPYFVNCRNKRIVKDPLE